jgi:phospholipase/carboxylesterase
MTQISLTHRLKKSNQKNPPVIFMLHGYGSDENDLFSFAGELPDKYTIISAKAPYALPGMGNAWYSINFEAPQGKFSNTEEGIRSRDLVLTFIDECINVYQLDKDKVSLLGFSQGGIISYALAMSYPERFDQVIALSAYVDKSLFIDDYTDKLHQHLRIFATHGSQDPVIPVEWARKNKPFLSRFTDKTNYSEYPIGHGINPDILVKLMRWLN